MKRMIAYAALWLLSVAAVASLLGAMNLPSYFALVRHGIAVEATVLRTEPMNHQLVHYSYIVDGRQYRDSGMAGVGNPCFKCLRPGDRIQAFYTETDHAVSVLGEPGPHFENELWSVLGGGLLLPTMVALVFTLRRRMRRRELTSIKVSGLR